MTSIIVNADDFGACSGVNRVIVEAHLEGIVTSASLLVSMPGSEEAACLARECPDLNIGLHISLPEESGRPVVDLFDRSACRTALTAQFRRFRELLGAWPTHLDSHHHVHMRPELRPAFQAAADLYGIPLRDCAGVRYCSSFYGRWAGESHPERISVGSLIRILEAEVGNRPLELACHPGRPDPTLASSYAVERELELRTLCDPRIRRFLEGREIALVSFAELSRFRSPV